MRIKATLVFILFYSFHMYGQMYEMTGNPYIKNFTRENFNSDPKIWSITENNLGEMFFASPTGLIKYDGSRWENYLTGGDSNILCVFNSDEDILYSSGYGNFGYWEKDDFGDLKYIKIFEEFEEQNQGFWRINEDSENLYFQSSIFIHIYNKISKKLDLIPAPSTFSFMSETDGRIFVGDIKKGLLEIKNNKIEFIRGTEKIEGIIVGVVADGEILKIFTDHKGVYLLENENLRNVKWKVNKELKSNNIFSIYKTDNGDLYIGTIRNGLYVLSSNGDVKFHTNKEEGIFNNTILSLYQDSKKNLWLGIDGGISHLEINSSISYLLDVHEDFGSVYTSLLKDSIIYIGTNQGLFAKNINKKNKSSKLIEASQGQVWLIDEIDGDIFVGHHKGAFILEKGKLKSFHKGAGVWVFRKHPKHDDIMYTGNYFGINIFKKEGNKWKFIKEIENFNESSRFMEFDKYSQLWVAHPTRGYHRIKFSEDGLNVINKEFYRRDSTNNINNVIMNLALIDGDVTFYSTLGFTNYDPIKNSFIKSDYITEIFKGIPSLTSLVQYDDMFWYTTKNSIGFVKRSENKFKRVQEQFFRIGSNNKADFTHISKFNENTYGINVDFGLAIYKDQVEEQKKDIYIETPKFRLIQFISSKDTLRGILGDKANFTIPYTNNYARFLFSAPNLKVGSERDIEYFLEGISKTWTRSSKSMITNFPALPPGNYTLKVRLVSGDGLKSDILKYKFSIDAPWYIKPFSLIIYFVIIVLSLFFVRRYYSRKILMEQMELRKKEEEKIIRQKEKLELKNLESDKKLLVLKEENYRIEIEKKNNELAASTMNNIRKNDLLNELKNDLLNLSKQKEDSKKKSDIKTILKKINHKIRNNDDWLTFELHFNKAHGNFFDRLREEFPILTSNDLKLCAYLKLNLSSKEIASLMSISTRSVEMSRYRLRKKINLDKDDSLSQFIGLY